MAPSQPKQKKKNNSMYSPVLPSQADDADAASVIFSILRRTPIKTDLVGHLPMTAPGLRSTCAAGRSWALPACPQIPEGFVFLWKHFLHLL